MLVEEMATAIIRPQQHQTSEQRLAVAQRRDKDLEKMVLLILVVAVVAVVNQESLGVVAAV
jgi:cell division protein FtsL